MKPFSGMCSLAENESPFLAYDNNTDRVLVQEKARLGPFLHKTATTHQGKSEAFNYGLLTQPPVSNEGFMFPFKIPLESKT